MISVFDIVWAIYIVALTITLVGLIFFLLLLLYDERP